MFVQSVCSLSCLFVWLCSHGGHKILDGGAAGNFCVLCPGVSVGRCFPDGSFVHLCYNEVSVRRRLYDKVFGVFCIGVSVERMRLTDKNICICC